MLAACRAILKALTAHRPATRYAVVYQKFRRWTVPLALPPRWLDYMIASHLKLLPPTKIAGPSQRLRSKKVA